MNKLKIQTNNRTGGRIAPQEFAKTEEGAKLYSPESEGDATALNEIRAQYADSKMLIGTLPPPASLKQGVSALAKRLQGKDLSVLIDKLSERLGFEASGTRLYEGLMAKCEFAPSLPSGLTLDELEHIRDEEHEHFLMLVETIQELGGDPTVLSPAADASSTATSGLCKVVSDPRSTVMQALDAILIAELTDNDGWSMLISICEDLDLPDIAKRFQEALKQEDEHLENVRKWLAAGLLTNSSEKASKSRSKPKPAQAKTKAPQRTAAPKKKAALSSSSKSDAKKTAKTSSSAKTSAKTTRAKAKRR